MNNIAHVLLNIPWTAVFIVLYIMIFIIVKRKDEKDFAVLLNDFVDKKYSDKLLCEKTFDYIKKHPFSLYNSDLMLKILPSLFACDKMNDVKKTAKKIRIVDVHYQLTINIIYTLFVLRESGFEREYSTMLRASKKRLRTKYQEWYSFFENNCRNIQVLHSDYSNKYLNGIKCYYQGVIQFELGDVEKANQLFAQACNTIGEKSFYNLLILKGYKL